MSVIEIPVAGGYVALVDEVDGELVGRHKWHPLVDRFTTYAQTSGSRAGGVKRVQLTMHRLLTGWPLTDHINGNGLDNRRCNLRRATVAQNTRNRRKTHGSSRFKGVVWVGRNKRWWVRGQIDGKSIYLGSYISEVDAALAYDTFARARFGEFAALNFPNPGERPALVEPVAIDADAPGVAGAVMPLLNKHDGLPDGDRYISTGQARALLNMARTTFSNYVAAAGIDFLRTPGGHRRFRESAIRALLDKTPVAIHHRRDPLAESQAVAGRVAALGGSRRG